MATTPLAAPDLVHSRTHRELFARDEDGGVLVFVAIALPMFLAMIAFVYDIGLARLHDTRLQIAADAAAMAAAADISVATAARQASDADALSAARALALPVAGGVADANYRDVFDDQIADSIELVHWDAANRQALPVDLAGGLPANAVAVVTRRNAQSNTVLPYVFARVAGLEGDGFSLNARAVALFAVPAGDCDGSTGIFSDDQLLIDYSGDNPTVDHYKIACLYGRAKVEVRFGGKDKKGIAIDDGSAIISPGPITKPYDSTHGVAVAQPLSLVLPERVSIEINDVVLGNPAPTRQQMEESYTTEPLTIEETKKKNKKPEPGEIDVNLSGIHIHATGALYIKNGTVLDNVKIWAEGDIEVGNDVTFTNVEIWTGGDFNLGSSKPANNVTADGLKVWALGSIDFATQKSTFEDLLLFSTGGKGVDIGCRGQGCGGGTVMNNATVYASSGIFINDRVELSKMRMISDGDVAFDNSPNPNNMIRIGPPDGCANNQFDSSIYAKGDVIIGNNTRVHATQIGSQKDLTVVGDSRPQSARDFGPVFSGSTAEVNGEATLGAKAKVEGCAKNATHGVKLPTGVGSGKLEGARLVQ